MVALEKVVRVTKIVNELKLEGATCLPDARRSTATRRRWASV